MNTPTPRALPPLPSHPPRPAARPVVSFARMLVLAQRRFRDRQQRTLAAPA